uniref:Uncharacterized protein n=1 Tax=Zea mays TaxID=4577 RepID=B4FIH6_MAIZE|nr:unknown [Zea mays]
MIPWQHLFGARVAENVGYKHWIQDESWVS